MAMSFQDIILALHHYWAERGCVLLQPYDTEKGAGTFHWATWLRALGPEPWRAAYVEPSRRPTDGRYGDSPNRFQHFLQYQVVLKPAPEDSQAVYLDSLRALGLDLAGHDVRFVEDDWESPTLGATGLGWEVWLDGMEVTQYTYFQQVGGIDLDPITLELTYGLERLAMELQGVESAFDLRWNAAITYGELYHQNEVQFSRFNFDEAGIELHLHLFDLYEAECGRMLDKDLVMPAFDLVLKCSHTFNILDARKVLGVAQRARYIARVRALARRTALAWLALRERLGWPLRERPLLKGAQVGSLS
jgi:glycyl-tRNA synthetase alpha chain